MENREIHGNAKNESSEPGRGDGTRCGILSCFEAEKFETRIDGDMISHEIRSSTCMLITYSLF